MAGPQSSPGIHLHPQHRCSCLIQIPSPHFAQWHVSLYRANGGLIRMAFLKFRLISFPLVAKLPSLLLQLCVLVLRHRMCSPPLLYTPLEDDNLKHHHCSWHFINGLPQHISRGCLSSWWCWQAWQGTTQKPIEGWLQLSGQRPQQLQDQVVWLGSSALAIPWREVQNTVELRCAFTSSCWAWSKGKQLPNATTSLGRLCPRWEHWIQPVKHTVSSWVMSTGGLLDSN